MIKQLIDPTRRTSKPMSIAKFLESRALFIKAMLDFQSQKVIIFYNMALVVDEAVQSLPENLSRHPWGFKSHRSRYTPLDSGPRFFGDYFGSLLM